MTRLNKILIPLFVVGFLAGCGQDNKEEPTQEQQEQEQGQEEEEEQHEETRTVKAYVANSKKQFDTQGNLLQEYKTDFDEEKRELSCEEIVYDEETFEMESKRTFSKTYNSDLNPLTNDCFNYSNGTFNNKTHTVYSYNELGLLISEETFTEYEENADFTHKSALKENSYDVDGNLTREILWNYNNNESKYVKETETIYIEGESKLEKIIYRYYEDAISPSSLFVYTFDEAHQIVRMNSYNYSVYRDEYIDDSVIYYTYSEGVNGSKIMKTVAYFFYNGVSKFTYAYIEESIGNEKTITYYLDPECNEVDEIENYKYGYEDEVIDYYYEELDSEYNVISSYYYDFSTLYGLIFYLEFDTNSGDCKYGKYENEFDELNRLVKCDYSGSPDNINYTYYMYETSDDYKEVYDEDFAELIRTETYYYFYR